MLMTAACADGATGTPGANAEGDVVADGAGGPDAGATLLEPEPIEPFEETGEDLSKLAPAAGPPVEVPPVATDSWNRTPAPQPPTTLAAVN